MVTGYSNCFFFWEVISWEVKSQRAVASIAFSVVFMELVATEYGKNGSDCICKYIMNSS